MSSNYDLLKAELQAQANALENSIDKYDALILIDQFIAAYQQQATSSANDVQSYSIGDRSVTRSGPSGYAKSVDELKLKLSMILRGSVSLPDFRLYGNSNQV